MSTSNAKTAIFQILNQVPPGKVLTYGHVAQMAGLGKAARFVGTTLKSLPADTSLPWHRIVNSQGKISLPEHHPGRKLQQARLQQEGVAFSKGKIDLKSFLWVP